LGDRCSRGQRRSGHGLAGNPHPRGEAVFQHAHGEHASPPQSRSAGVPCLRHEAGGSMGL